MNLLRSGHGARRPLVVAFYVHPTTLLAALDAAGLSSACVLLEMVLGAHQPWGVTLKMACEAGWAPEGDVVLVGWSAGCAGVREALRQAADATAVVALDGTAGPAGVVPPAEHSLAPWRKLVSEAREGERLAVLAHTYQTYTEQLSKVERYPATVSVVRAVTGLALERGGAPHAPAEHLDGGLVVLSYASKSIDGEAHKATQRIGLPYALAKHVAPWLALREQKPEHYGNGLAALNVARGYVGRGEDPPGSNAGDFVRSCFAGCVRDVDGDGDLEKIGISRGEWCAAFVGLCDHEAGLARVWRAAVWELCRDARGVGALRDVGDYQPQPGDLAVWGRNGMDPRRGGLGHVAYVEQPPGEGGDYVTIDGNHGSWVARVPRSMRLDPPLAWIVSARG